MLKPLVFRTQVPMVIWVHGGEALGWYRRMFKYSLSLPSARKLLLDIPTITRSMYRWNRLIAYANRTRRVNVIFVSQWMKRMLERDSLSNALFSEVIPNPIDTDLFAYAPKAPEHRKRILVLRSFATEKYAGDVVVQAILELSHRDFFHDLEFYVRGWGALFDQLTMPLRQFENVHLYKGFVEQRTIPDIHRDYGVFLCPTRQDAQGVSMCEAMSSGLVPIASDNTAIPEFVTDGQTGFLTRSCREIADRVEFLYRNPDKFQFMSEQAATSVRKIASADYVTAQEIAIISMMATVGDRSDGVRHL